jgi:hypothetical protein
MVDESVGRMVREANHNLKFYRHADFAMDMISVAYYDDRENSRW